MLEARLRGLDIGEISTGSSFPLLVLFYVKTHASSCGPSGTLTPGDVFPLGHMNSRQARPCVWAANYPDYRAIIRVARRQINAAGYG